VLDVLHKSDSTVIRGPSTWNGRGRVLAGRLDAENNLGKTRPLEASTG